MPTHRREEPQEYTYRHYELHRDDDVNGVSGEGVVADFVEFDEPIRIEWPDGEVTELGPGWGRMRWRGELTSTVMHASIETAEKIHGHGGRSRFVRVEATA